MTIEEQIDNAAERALREAQLLAYVPADQARAKHADRSATTVKKALDTLREEIDRNAVQDPPDMSPPPDYVSDRNRLREMVDNLEFDLGGLIAQHQRREGGKRGPGTPGTPQRHEAFQTLMRQLTADGMSARAAAQTIAERAAAYWAHHRFKDKQFQQQVEERLFRPRSYITPDPTAEERVLALAEQIRTEFSKAPRKRLVGKHLDAP